jgi:hypothetical protein
MGARAQPINLSWLLEVHAHGSLLCQDTFGSGVLGWVVTGPGVASPKCILKLALARAGDATLGFMR